MQRSEIQSIFRKVRILQLWPGTKNTGSLDKKMSPGVQNGKPLGEEGFLPSTQRRAKLCLFQRMSFSPPNPTPPTQISRSHKNTNKKNAVLAHLKTLHPKSTFQQGELRPWMVVMKADQL